jgi:hypothetical protein
MSQDMNKQSVYGHENCGAAGFGHLHFDAENNFLLLSPSHTISLCWFKRDADK